MLSYCLVEDYRLGYPRFTALLAAHGPYFTFRCFRQVRARLLLQKQDRLTVLEEQLESCDAAEPCPLFLGKSRGDINAERASILSEIDKRLEEYDSIMERTRRILQYERPRQRDIRGLRNWVEGNACLAEEETAYLDNDRDLITLGETEDNALSAFENWAEDMLTRWRHRYSLSPSLHQSSDKNVFLYSGTLIKRLARGILLFLLSFTLIVPTVTCPLVPTMPARMTIIATATVCYLVGLSILTNSKSLELAIAGTTYATVLVVFISNTGA